MKTQLQCITARVAAMLVIVTCASTLATSRAHAAPVPYAFTMNATTSGAALNTATLAANTSGTLIGNWDATTNPTGTRTKPGIFGTFGATENVAVNTTINFTANGTPNVPLGGSFGMQIDTAAGTVVIDNYGAALSGTTTGALALNAAITFDSFRTRQPSSTFPGVPVTVPVGNATITDFSIVQIDTGVIGTLTPTGVNTYSFFVSPLVNVNGSIDLQGSATPFGPITTALPMQGSITLAGNSATLTSLAPINLSDTQNPNLALPALPFDLPTVLPAGDTAHIVFNLTLNQISAVLAGQVSTNASGSVVPEPTMSIALMFVTAIAARRRRRAAA